MTRSGIASVYVGGILFGYGWGYRISVQYFSGRSRTFDFGGNLPVSAMVSMIPKSVHDFILTHRFNYYETMDFEHDHVSFSYTFNFSDICGQNLPFLAA